MLNAASCSTWQLYVIIDRAASRNRDLAWIAKQAICGGADVIQLRDKDAPTRLFIEEATRVLAITTAAHIPLIINDRIDVAVAVGADGVHVGQEDLPLLIARQILGPERIIGKSTHRLDQAIAGEREGADYLAIGPIYPTPTKPDYPSVGLPLIREVNAHVRIPRVCIGGIDDATLPEVVAAGATCVAVVRAVCSADDPARAARNLKRLLTQSVRTGSPAGL